MGVAKFVDIEMQQVESKLKEALRTKNKTVEAALKQLADSGGKRLRPMLTVLGGSFGNYKSDQIVPIAAAVEIIHMATLVHDDIIDDAKLRRGTETIQSKLGKDVAVYSGDFLFSRAFMLLADIAEINLLKDMARGVAFICDSEIAQNEQKYNNDITVRQYLKRIGGKTAALFAVSLAAGAHKSGCEKKLVNQLGVLGKNIGMAFQIVDDLLDFTGEQLKVGKPLFSDAKQGIYTLPVIYALNSRHRDTVLKALDRLTEDEGVLLREILFEGKTIDRSKRIAERYVDKALKSAAKLPERDGKQMIIDIIHKQIERKF
ncbi:MAG: polyprenyl synthetase family protein [Bacillota bacterium]